MNRLLDKLYAGENSLRLKRIIEIQLCVTFGLYKYESDSDLLTNQTMSLVQIYVTNNRRLIAGKEIRTLYQQGF